MVGVAVNVTLVPEQVGLDPDVIAMATDGTADGALTKLALIV